MTDKQRRFVEEYCVDFNATQAAIRAGYSENTARQMGSENLSKPNIAGAIEDRMERLSMSAGEATKRLTEWGRGTIEPFVSDGGGIDLSTPKARRNWHLVKKIKVYDDRTELELHDAKDAVIQIAKIHGLYTERVEIGGKVLLVRDVDEVKAS